MHLCTVVPNKRRTTWQQYTIVSRLGGRGLESAVRKKGCRAACSSSSLRNNRHPVSHNDPAENNGQRYIDWLWHLMFTEKLSELAAGSLTGSELLACRARWLTIKLGALNESVLLPGGKTHAFVLPARFACYERGLLHICRVHSVFTQSFSDWSCFYSIHRSHDAQARDRASVKGTVRLHFSCVIECFFIFHLVSLQFSVFVPIYHVFQSFYIFNNV